MYKRVIITEISCDCTYQQASKMRLGYKKTQQDPVSADFPRRRPFFGLEARSLIAADRGSAAPERVAGEATIDVSEKIKLARIECRSVIRRRWRPRRLTDFTLTVEIGT